MRTLLRGAARGPLANGRRRVWTVTSRGPVRRGLWGLLQGPPPGASPGVLLALSCRFMAHVDALRGARGRASPPGLAAGRAPKDASGGSAECPPEKPSDPLHRRPRLRQEAEPLPVAAREAAGRPLRAAADRPAPPRRRSDDRRRCIIAVCSRRASAGVRPEAGRSPPRRSPSQRRARRRRSRGMGECRRPRGRGQDARASSAHIAIRPPRRSAGGIGCRSAHSIVIGRSP